MRSRVWNSFASKSIIIARRVKSLIGVLVVIVVIVRGGNTCTCEKVITATNISNNNVFYKAHNSCKAASSQRFTKEELIMSIQIIITVYISVKHIYVFNYCD